MSKHRDTETCLWVRDATYRAHTFGTGVMADLESLRCKPGGHVACRPCGERFGYWPAPGQPSANGENGEV